MKTFLRISAVVLAVALTLTAIAAFSAAAVTGKRGDADNDNDVTIIDATKIQRVLVGYDKEEEAWVNIFGDITGDGLDITDATAIQRFLAEYGNPYNIGEEIEAELTEPTDPTEETVAPTEAPTDAPTEAPTQKPTSPRSPR